MDDIHNNKDAPAERVKLSNSDVQVSGVLPECAKGKGKFGLLKPACRALLNGVKMGTEKLGIYNIRELPDGISMDVDLSRWLPALQGAWSLTLGSNKQSGHRMVIVSKDRQGVCINWSKLIFGNFKFPREFAWMETFASFIGMDKIGLCVWEIGLNILPFGFRIQGITTGLIKIPFSFFVMSASKNEMVFAFAISISADINAFLRNFLGPMQFLLPALSLQRFDLQLCTGKANLARWPSLAFQDDRLNALLPGFEIAAVAGFDAITDTWFGFGKWAKKYWPGEFRIGMFFREFKFGFETMLPDTFLHPDFGMKGARINLYIDADFRKLFSISVQQLTVKITELSAELAAITAAAVGTAGIGAVAYVKPILTFLGIKSLPIGGSFQAGVFTNIAGVVVQWTMGFNFNVQFGASLSDCKFDIAVKLQQVGMWNNFFGIPRLDVGNLIGSAQWGMVDPYLLAFDVGGQFALRPPPKFPNEPTIEGELFASIDTRDFWKNSFFVATLRNVVLGPVLRNFGVADVDKLPSWLTTCGFPDDLSLSFAMAEHTTPSGATVPAGFQMKGTMTGFGARTKIELAVSATSFRMLLDLREAMTLPKLMKLLSIRNRLPDWLAKTGFTDELLLQLDLDTFVFALKGGLNLFGLKHRVEIKIKPDLINILNSELLAHVEGPVIDFGDINPKLGWVGVLSRSPEEDKEGPLFHFEFTPSAQALWFEAYLKNLLFEGYGKFKITEKGLQANLRAKLVGLFSYSGSVNLGNDGFPLNVNSLAFDGMIDTTALRNELTRMLDVVRDESGRAFRVLQEKATELRQKVAAGTDKIARSCNCGYKCDSNLGAALMELDAAETLSEEEREAFDISLQHHAFIESEARLAELMEMGIEGMAAAGILNLEGESDAELDTAVTSAQILVESNVMSADLLDAERERLLDDMQSDMEVPTSFLEIMQSQSSEAGWRIDLNKMRRDEEERMRRFREEAERRLRRFKEEEERKAREAVERLRRAEREAREAGDRFRAEMARRAAEGKRQAKNLLRDVKEASRKVVADGKKNRQDRGQGRLKSPRSPCR